LPTRYRPLALSADLDNYLLNFTWHLNRINIEREFKDVIYDPEADPGTVRRELEQLNREYPKANAAGDLLPDKIAEVADQLENIRMEVLSTVAAAESEGQSQDLRSRGKLSALDWERRTKQKAFSAISRRFRRSRLALKLSDRLTPLTATPLCSYLRNAKILAKRK